MSKLYFGSFKQVAVSVSMINLFVGLIDTLMQVWWREHCERWWLVRKKMNDAGAVNTEAA